MPETGGGRGADSEGRYAGFWFEQAGGGDAGDDAPRLEDETKADVCIVGGGYTGLWTALRLKELDPAIDVVMVEAAVCGAGASGRNAGFAMSWWSKLPTLKKLFGTSDAVALATASVDALTEIGDFLGSQGLGEHFRRDGWLWTATNAAQVGAWQETVATVQQATSAPIFKEIDRDELVQRTGSSANIAGVFEASAASLQPAVLALALRRAAIAAGVRIHERSPMVELGRTRPPSRCIAVVSSDMVVTEPQPEALAEIGLTSGVCVSDSRLIVNYYRTTPDGRLAFGKSLARLAYGGRLGAGFHGLSPQERDIRTVFDWVFPSLRATPTVRSWTGPVDRPIPASRRSAGLAAAATSSSAPAIPGPASCRRRSAAGSLRRSLSAVTTNGPHRR